MNNKMQNDRSLSIGGLRRRKGFCRFLATVAAAMFLFVSTAPAFADPTSVLGGNAVLTGMARATLDANDANAAAFSSSAASAVLDWSKFNIGSGQSMSFNGASTTFFNLVDGAAGKSQIDGMINGSGNVWVINPAGIAFGAGSSVNVGGLFAAAAGNVENAAALRDGTAMTPAFSSFAGTVDASKGSFTADQVALMGKTVTTAGGDFSGAKGLSITASTGAMTVDEVEGGRVSVNISDFSADDAEVVLGDLHIDGSLSVKATGNIVAGARQVETPANKPMLLMAEKKGPVVQAGDIDIEGADLEIEGKLQSTAGHVDVLAYGSLDVNAEVNAADYASLQALGDIDVNADVTAGSDATIYSYNGSVTVEANKTVSALGNVDITAGMGDGVNGDVTINGNVESSFGNVMLYSGYGYQSTGDVTINGNVTAEYGGIDAYAGFGYALGTPGNLTVNGNLTGYSSVSLKTGNGDIKVRENAVVSATGIGGEVDVYTAADAGYGIMSGEGHSGDIVVNGSLKADNVYGVVDVVAGKEVGATGTITFNGNASSDYMTELATRTGKISVDGGEVSSSGNVMINNESGDIKIAQGASVISKGGSQGQEFDEDYGIPSAPSVMVLGAMDEDGTSNVKIDGAVTALDPNGQITIRTGFDGRTLPGGFIGGSGAITGEGEINSAGALEMSTGLGEVNFAGVVKAKDADFKVDEMRNDYYKEKYGYEYRESALSLDNKKNDFTGTVTAHAGGIVIRDANDMEVGNMTAYDLDLSLKSQAGNLTVREGAVVQLANTDQSSEFYHYYYGHDRTLSMQAALDSNVEGGVIIKGEVRADVPYGQVDILAGGVGSRGDITVENGGVVSAEPVGAIAARGIELASAYLQGARGDVKIATGGKVLTDGKAMLSAGDGWNPDTGVEIGTKGNVVVDGTVQGGHHATLTTKDGDISLGADSAISIVSEGEVTVVSGIKDGGSGNITVAGDVQADVDNGKVLLASGYGKEAQGDVTITGNVMARQIAFAQGGIGEDAKGNVTIADGATFVAGSDATVEAHADLYTGSGDIVIQKGATVEAKGAYAQVNAVAGYGKESIGSIEVGGTARAVGSKGIVNLLASYGEQSKGGVSVSGHVESDLFSLLTTGEGDISVSRGGSVVANANNGKVELGSGLHNGAEGNVGIDGRVAALGKEAIVSVESGRGKGSHGNVSIAGSVSAGDQAVVYAGFGEGASGSAAVSGSVTAGGQAGILTRSGSISVNGSVRAGHDAQVIAGVNNGRGGDISFGANGRVTAGSLVNVVTAGGSVRQSGASVAINQSGYAEVVSIPSAVSAPEVNFNVNGNVGAGTRSPVAANGSIYAQVSGSASLAAANGQSFSGGSKPAHTPNVKLSVSDVTATPTASTTESAGRLVINTTPASQSLASGIDWGGASDNSSIFAGGDLSIYTAGSLNPYGLLVAGRDLTVSAASFGDLSYLRAGGKLTINNVGHPSHPQIAYFESVNGVEPNINNLPNDMVIFIDGRLAGGNLQIINKFGATEAFPVSTPELKSEQGIFGNPVFLHGDLDVANPMAVGNVDYMLQEIPRLTLASDFPLEVDKSVNTAGLNPKDVYRFGQHAQVAEEKPQAEQEEKKDDKASAEKSAEPKVAMR